VDDEDDAPLWDDLDADDWDEPNQVPEYVHEICAYLHKTEVKLLLRFPAQC
jgi:hypothetical protein